MTVGREFERIQKFKHSGSAVCDSVNYAYVVAPFLYDISLVGWCKKVIFSLFFSTSLRLINIEGRSLLLFYSCRQKNRSDYDYIITGVRNALNNDYDYVESEERFSLLQCWQTLYRLPSSLKLTSGYESGLMQRLSVSLLIAKYRTAAVKALSTLLEHRSCIVTFCDAQPPENLFTQMARAIGIFTVTNQHGQYRLLRHNNMSPDAEAYANFVSEKMLCWGQATRSEFVKFGISPKRMMITGWIRQYQRVQKSEDESRTGVLGVMLNGENGKESNAILIQTAKQVANALTMRYFVRLHPANNANNYAHLLDENCVAIERCGLQDYLAKVDFSIAHMSGAVIECLCSGSLIYLLDDGYLADIFCIDGLSYKDSDAIVLAASEDLESPKLSKKRMLELGYWFNDDSDQSEHIRSIIYSNS